MKIDDVTKNITVTMSIDAYEYFKDAEHGRDYYIDVLNRAKQSGIAVMTDELKSVIEQNI